MWTLDIDYVTQNNRGLYSYEPLLATLCRFSMIVPSDVIYVKCSYKFLCMV